MLVLVTKTQKRKGNCLKRGVYTVCSFKRGLDKKEDGGVFEEGWYHSGHYDTMGLT